MHTPYNVAVASEMESMIDDVVTDLASPHWLPQLGFRRGSPEVMYSTRWCMCVVTCELVEGDDGMFTFFSRKCTKMSSYI